MAFALSVQMSDINDPIIQQSPVTGTSFTLKTTVGGDGKTKEAAYKTYTPFESGSNNQNSNFYINGYSLGNSTGGSLNFNIDIELDGLSSQSVFAALRKDNTDTSYVVVTEVAVSSDGSITLPVNFLDLCDAGANLGGDFNCTTLTGSDSATEDFYIYLFVGGNGLSVDGVIDPADNNYDNGIFIYTYASTNVSDYTGGSTVMSSLVASRGDQSAYLDYAGAINSTTYIDGTVLYESADTTALSELFDTGASESGEILVKNLTNGVTKNYYLRFKDLFGYVSGAAGPATVTPADIQTLLEEKSCYLVTAGFQRDHYVLDYFRHIRDSYLLKNSLGRSIVNIYYSTAPKYALFIYQNKVLSLLVRGVSYVLYAVLKNFLWIATLLVLVALGVRIKGQWQKEFS